MEKVTKRAIEKLGIETSLLGFGCMRFPTRDGRIDEARAEKMLDEAIARGVNYIDTAFPYHGGESEPFVGKVLDKYPRDSYYLATKLPCWDVKTPEDAPRIFENQLKRLNKEHIDFYLLHALGRDRFRDMVKLGVIEYCEELKKQGKIKYLGFSFHDSYEAFEEIAGYRDWDFCQIQLNYMDTNEQAGLKGYALTEKLNIPLVIMEPVKGGSLANLPEEVCTGLRAIDPKASNASFALRWVASFPNVRVVLSGMSTEEQTEDNLNTFTNFKPLSEEEKKTIETLAETLRSRVNNGCTGCNYCMPCPAGVDIPHNFRIWNTYGMYGDKNGTRWQWEHGIDQAKKAHSCVECGACEAACPQHLSIRENLKQLQKELDEL